MSLSDYCMASAPHTAYSESHTVGSAVTLSPLVHTSRLSMTTPGGLGIVTWCDPMPPLEVHPLYYHPARCKPTCHIPGFPWTAVSSKRKMRKLMV